jgi:8-oxo-dGTP diphosphatase
VEFKALKKTIESLKKDRLGNINLINFIENTHITGIERIGNSLLVRGNSDRNWVYIKCSSIRELSAIKGMLNEEDKCFAAIEDWMFPVLIKDEGLLWGVSMTQFYLPDDVDLPEPVHPTKALSEKDAGTVYDNSEYQDYISVEYIQDRIRAGISKGIYENNKLVAWGLTHDDGGLGSLHVLRGVRRKGYGLSITLSLIKEVRRAKQIPFCYIEQDNYRSINLVSKPGFIRHRNCRWFQIK